MQNAYRSGPTLETIPTELKLMIAAHLDPDVPHDLRWSQLAQHDAQIRRPTLASLSLVSRSWAAALEGLRCAVSCPAPSPCVERGTDRAEQSVRWTVIAHSCCRY